MPRNTLSDQAVGFILKVEAKTALGDLEKAAKLYTKIERRVRSAGDAFKTSTQDIVDSINSFTDTSKELMALISDITEALGKSAKKQVDDEVDLTSKLTTEFKKRGSSYKSFADGVRDEYQKLKKDVGEDFVRAATGSKPTPNQDAPQTTSQDKIDKLNKSIDAMQKTGEADSRDLLGTTANISTDVNAGVEKKLDNLIEVSKNAITDASQVDIKPITQAIGEGVKSITDATDLTPVTKAVQEGMKSAASDSSASGMPKVVKVDDKGIKDITDALGKARFLGTVNKDMLEKTEKSYGGIAKAITELAEKLGVTKAPDFSLTPSALNQTGREKIASQLQEFLKSQKGVSADAIRDGIASQQKADHAPKKEAGINIAQILTAFGMGKIGRWVTIGIALFREWKKKMTAERLAEQRRRSAGPGGPGGPPNGPVDGPQLPGANGGGSALSAFGLTKATVITGALTAVATAVYLAVSAVNEFDNEMLQMQRTAAATRDEMKQMSQQILEISLTSGIATERLADVSAALRSKGGFKSIDNDFGQITEAAAKMSDVIDVSGGEMADFLADVSMGMRIGKQNAIGFGATIVKIAKEGGVSFEQLKDSVLGVKDALRRLPIASENERAGIVKQTAVYAQQLAKNYGDATEAANLFNAASALGTKEMGQLAMLLEQGGFHFNQEQIRAMAMTKDGLAELQEMKIISSKALKNSFDAQNRDITMVGDAFGNINQIMSDSLINLDEFREGTKNALKPDGMEQINEQWKEMQDSMTRMGDLFMNTVTAIAVLVAKPILDPLISAMESLLGVFKAIPTPLKKLWAIGVKVGGAMQPFAIIMTQLSMAFKLAAFAIRMTFKPFEVFYEQLAKTEAFNGLLQGVSKVFTALSTLKEFISAFMDGDEIKSAKLADKFDTLFVEGMEMIPDKITQLFESLPKVFEGAIAAFTGNDSKINSAAGRIGKAIFRGIGAFILGIPKMIIAALAALPKIMGIMFQNALMGAVNTAAEAIKGMIPGYNTFNKLFKDQKKEESKSKPLDQLMMNKVIQSVTPFLPEQMIPDEGKKFLKPDPLGTEALAPQPINTANTGSQADGSLLTETERQSSLLERIVSAIESGNRKPDRRAVNYTNTTNIVNRKTANGDLLSSMLADGK